MRLHSWETLGISLLPDITVLSIWAMLDTVIMFGAIFYSFPLLSTIAAISHALLGPWACLAGTCWRIPWLRVIGAMGILVMCVGIFLGDLYEVIHGSFEVFVRNICNPFYMLFGMYTVLMCVYIIKNNLIFIEKKKRWLLLPILLLFILPYFAI